MLKCMGKRIGLLWALCFTLSLVAFNQEAAAEKKACWDVLTPEGKALYKEWSDFMGFTSKELVEQNDPAPEIKPGTVITPDNAASFPNLKKVCVPKIYDQISSRSSYAFLEEMEIVDTQPRYFPKTVLEGMKENDKKCKTDPVTNQLLNWEYGIPFPHPKTGPELMWNVLTTFVGTADELAFEPYNIQDFDANGVSERMRKGNLYVLFIMGRHSNRIGPKHIFPGFEDSGISNYGSLVFTFPQDEKGTSFVRTRYWDPEKPDAFIGYIPAMRRIRTLSGSDAQDPIGGSEYTWDMWGLDWQKISTNIFPNTYNYLGEKTILVPTFNFKPTCQLVGNQIKGRKWEKRVAYVLEIKSQDPSYYYSKRISYIDKETLKNLYEEYYDRKGELWRTWLTHYWRDPEGFHTMDGDDIVNWIDKRRTVLMMNAKYKPTFVGPDYFKLKFLAQQAR
jgi:hypothetical protein